MAELFGALMRASEEAFVKDATEAEMAAMKSALERSFAESLGIDGGKAVVEDGVMKVVTKDGFEADVKTMGTALREGNFAEFAKSAYGQSIENTALKDMFENYSRSLPGNVVVEEAKAFEDAAKELSNNKIAPSSQEELEKLAEQNEKLQKTLNEMDAKIEKAAKEGKTTSWGKWVVGGIAGLTAYEIIKHHQDAMSGCWKITKNSDGTVSKCKVGQYTCSSGSAEANSAPCSHFDKPPVDGNGDEPTDYCSKTKDGCSQYCDCSKLGLKCGATTAYKCVQADFWDSAGDIGNGIGTIGDSILDKLMNLMKQNWMTILIVIGIAILAIFLLSKIL